MYIKSAAKNLLRRHNIIYPPVPVKQLLKNYASLYYFDKKMDPDFIHEAGFTLYKDMSYFVYINRDNTGGRDNFTLAHELGHIVLHHLEYINPNTADNTSLKLLDRDADKFASYILMPDSWVRISCQLYPPNCAANIARIKEAFQVSWQALMIKLDELGIQSFSKSISFLQERS